MRMAVAEARRGVRAGEGGPFGAVIVRDGVPIARGHNRVVAANDPTAHAEIVALRRAARKLGRFHLPDCVLFTTCEPCPMCLAAIHWARIKVFWYGCTRRDAARIGFADKDIYEFMAGRPAKGVPRGRPLLRGDCLEVFAEWFGRRDRVPY
jgi:guanine deaminase